jgi:hypothetical protein
MYATWSDRRRGQALLEKAPDFDVLFTAGTKASARYERPPVREKYILARKARTLYARHVAVRVKSITTVALQTLYSYRRMAYLAEEARAFVDDVISTAEFASALRQLVDTARATPSRRRRPREGDAAKRTESSLSAAALFFH